MLYDAPRGSARSLAAEAADEKRRRKEDEEEKKDGALRVSIDVGIFGRICGSDLVADIKP